MKRSSILLAAIALAGGVAAFMTMSPLEAQSPKPAAKPTGKYAVCDVGGVLLRYDRTIELTAELDQKQADNARDDKNRVAAIKQAEKVLEKYKLGTKQYEAQEQKLMKHHITREVSRRLSELSLARVHRKLMESTYSDLLSAIAAVAEKEGYDLVLHNDSSIGLASQSAAELRVKMRLRKCLYVSDAIDITEVVLKQANEQYKAGKKGASKVR